MSRSVRQCHEVVMSFDISVFTEWKRMTEQCLSGQQHHEESNRKYCEETQAQPHSTNVNMRKNVMVADITLMLLSSAASLIAKEGIVVKRIERE